MKHTQRPHSSRTYKKAAMLEKCSPTTSSRSECLCLKGENVWATIPQEFKGVYSKVSINFLLVTVLLKSTLLSTFTASSCIYHPFYAPSPLVFILFFLLHSSSVCQAFSYLRTANPRTVLNCNFPDRASRMPDSSAPLVHQHTFHHSIGQPRTVPTTTATHLRFL